MTKKENPGTGATVHGAKEQRRGSLISNNTSQTTCRQRIKRIIALGACWGLLPATLACWLVRRLEVKP